MKKYHLESYSGFMRKSQYYFSIFEIRIGNVRKRKKRLLRSCIYEKVSRCKVHISWKKTIKYKQWHMVLHNGPNLQHIYYFDLRIFPLICIMLLMHISKNLRKFYQNKKVNFWVFSGFQKITYTDLLQKLH